MRRIIIILLFTLIISLLNNSCSFNYLKVGDVNIKDTLTLVSSYIDKPVKVHLADGTLIFYEKGFYLNRDTLWGIGKKYDIFREKYEMVKKMPFKDILGIRYYEEELDPWTFTTSFISYFSLISIPLIFLL